MCSKSVVNRAAFSRFLLFQNLPAYSLQTEEAGSQSQEEKAARFVLYLSALWVNAERTPEKSDRQIATGLGVTNKTVAAQRKGLERTEEIPQLTTNIGADGKERPRQAQRKPVSVFNPSGHFGHPKKAGSGTTPG